LAVARAAPKVAARASVGKSVQVIGSALDVASMSSHRKVHASNVSLAEMATKLGRVKEKEALHNLTNSQLSCGKNLAKTLV